MRKNHLHDPSRGGSDSWELERNGRQILQELESEELQTVQQSLLDNARMKLQVGPLIEVLVYAVEAP